MEYFADTDTRKDLQNQQDHGVSFRDAQQAFSDPNRLIFQDTEHSTDTEFRYKCVGKVLGRVCTVRFVYRDGKVRIFGAGYWRKEKKLYEQKIRNR
jgi:uncharacterized DUF497 family protein